VRDEQQNGVEQYSQRYKDVGCGNQDFVVGAAGSPASNRQKRELDQAQRNRGTLETAVKFDRWKQGQGEKEQNNRSAEQKEANEL